MKLSTFLSVLTILILLFTNAHLFGQCHGGSSSHNDHNDNSVKSKNQPGAAASTEVIYYACPMHPERTSLKSGTCSKCGMNLELKKANLYKSEQQKDSIYYSCSMHHEVLEEKSGKCPKCGMELIKELETPDK